MNVTCDNVFWSSRVVVLAGGLVFTACGNDVHPAAAAEADASAASAVDAGPAFAVDAAHAVDAVDAAAMDGAAPAAVDSGPLAASLTVDPFDVPVSGLQKADLDAFSRGDDLFGLTLREQDGLGPLYTRDNCGGCHASALRGPGLVQKMSVVQADGKTPTPDQSKLAFGHTVHPLLAAGAKTPIVPPANDPSVRVSIRVGVPVLGRGYLEAVLDSELVRVASEQATRTDGIHGRVNHVTYASEANSDTRFHTHQKGDTVLGRFGLKARIATLDDFCADALQGDMGMTSPLRPQEFVNPDGLLDDSKPGIDLTMDSVNTRANYTRGIAIPRRDTNNAVGLALFQASKCSVCHAPSLHTRADYPLAPLADIDAPIFTDLLLHDMGDGLADSLPEGEAGPRDWRTAPLIGLRFYKTFLHDGRAQTIEQAIAAHASNGSEANGSIQLFDALSEMDRKLLLAFVQTL